jgi:hypothetical protein
MSAKVSYRIAAVLLAIQALGHLAGFRNVPPGGHAGSVVLLMQDLRFPVEGVERTYWDFYLGQGFVTTIFLLFAAALSWQLGDAKRETLRQMPVVPWALAICLLACSALSWIYFVAVPATLASVITGFLMLGAWSVSR